MSTPIHLHPTAPLAARVLLPGDPGRALLLAQELIEAPRMFNHNRGLWGYTGTARDGAPLSIQSTGMGGPSAAIVITELIELGAERLLRVGTCGAFDSGLGLGELLVAPEAISGDGTSLALGSPGRVAATPELVDALAAAGARRRATTVSTDVFYEERDGVVAEWIAAGATVVEMEAATLFTLAQRRGVQAGALLIVSDLIGPVPRRIEPEALHDAERRAGALALSALAGDDD